MAAHRNREEAVNTQLAMLLARMGVTADAETIHLHGRHRPDVLLQLRGLRVAIEGKFEDQPSAERIVLADARKRVAAGIAHMAAAAIYPRSVRATPTAGLLDRLATATLRYRIISEAAESDWIEGTPAALMDSLRRAQESLTRDDIVAETAKALSMRLETVAGLWIGQVGACERLSKLLGMPAQPDETAGAARDRRETAARVSALVLANAFIFHEQLAQTDTRVEPLRRIAKEADVVGATARHWRWIWENINYVPIFQLGERVLDELPSSATTLGAVQSLQAEAQAICRRQAALRHDLMGRIYHWLLHDAKYLGTYYTAVPAATLLLKLVFALPWPADFTNPRELADFKVADLACGTGTLLMAAAQALTDRYIRDRAERDLSLDEKDITVLHQTLMQNVLHGYDILPTAVHLTASTLALMAPEVAFRNMNLFVMPMGVDHGTPRLGSLDFLSGPQITTQFALDHSQLDTVRTGAARTSYANARVPQLDLCVMNPPFVSSRYGNRLFGSLPRDRAALQKALSQQARQLAVSATAGLGALFVPLAERHTKPGGRIAFVLPVALATGEAWGPIRKRIADGFHLELVVTSHDAERPSFSENTDLSEVLFVARRLNARETPGATTYVNLWRNPRTIHESLDSAARISAAIASIGGEADRGAVIPGAAAPIGEVASLAAPQGTDNWTGAIFAQGYLMRAHWALDSLAELRLPGETAGHPVPLCRLDALGTLGYDVRDIFDAFEVDRTGTAWSPHPAFWNHDADKVRCIAQAPNATLLARSAPLAGRKLKDAAAVWSKAGRILLVSRLWPVTHRVLATSFPRTVLGNTWWAFDDSRLTEPMRKALLLWLNSTLGLLMYFGRRAITRSAWMQMKKPAWSATPVLDVRALTARQSSLLAMAYDQFAARELAPISQLDADAARRAMDAALCAALDLPPLDALRELLAREPGLTARRIGPSGRPGTPSGLAEDQDEFFADQD